MPLREIRLTLVTLVVALTCSGCGLKKAPVTTVLDQDPGFTVSLPSDWWVDDLDPNTLTSTAWTDKDNVGKVAISVRPMRGAEQEWWSDLDTESAPGYSQALAEEVGSSPRFQDVKILRVEATELDGKPATSLVFTATGNQKSRWRQWVFTPHPHRPKTLVELRFLSEKGKEAQFQETFEAVRRSWAWKDA